MILTIDVGNTHIVFGGVEEGRVRFFCRLATDAARTEDEYEVTFHNLLQQKGVSAEEIEGGIISSVVPALQKTLYDAVYMLTGKKCLILSPDLDHGLTIRIDNAKQLGSDRIADAVGALSQYPAPILIFDMGTATTFSVLDKEGVFLGGLIMPGAMIGLDALASRTSKLPQISLDVRPENIIGKNTVDCMQNGILYGNAAMLDGVIDRIAEELGEMPTVIATGGLSAAIVPFCRRKVITDKELMLKGLYAIYKRNRP